MKIGVAGLGMVSKLGDAGNVRQLLTENSWFDPRELPAGHTLGLDQLSDYDLPQSLLRRMSHFAKIALLSACRAVQDSGRDLAGKSVGIIQGSVYGPIISGIQAFDELIDFGDNQLSPTNFSGSVFNTSATYLSLAFGIQGSTLAHTGGLDTLYNSLLVASLWLESGAVEYVIVGIGDEYTTFFDRETPAISGQPTGFLPTGEGWTTFIFKKAQPAKYGQLEFGYSPTLPATTDQPNIYSFWHEQSPAERFLDHARNNQACFPVGLRGSYPSGAAFDVALALLCKKNGRFLVTQPTEGVYQIQNLGRTKPVCCYSVAENGGVHYYRVL
jgi:hypothetical protein